MEESIVCNCIDDEAFYSNESFFIENVENKQSTNESDDKDNNQFFYEEDLHKLEEMLI